MSGAPSAGPGARRGRLAERLAGIGLDALLVTDLVNTRYLSGFTGSAGSLLVGADGEAILATDGRYRDQAAAEASGVELVVNPPPGWVRAYLPPGGVLAVEGHALAWARVLALQDQLDDCRLVDAGRLVEALRLHKEPAEVQAIATACTIGDEAFADLIGWLEPGRTEREIARRLERTLVDLGAADRAFPAIVAAGPHTAVPHHRPTDRRLAPGELLKLDFGAQVDGYHSDMTRMVACGDPDRQLQEMFVAVRTAQAAGVVAAVEGAESAAVDSACRAVLAAAGLADRFSHGTGHGVGLEIHEDPYLRPVSPGGPAAAGGVATLAARMVLTVEPGVYLPGVGGIRIEDTLVIEPEGAAPRVLTRTPHDLVVL